MRPHPGDDLVGDGLGPVGQLIRRQALGAVPAEEHDLVLESRRRDVRHVHHRDVHAHPAANRGPATADEHVGQVAQAAVVSVGISHGQDREPCGVGGHISASITDEGALGHVLDLGDAGLPGQRGREGQLAPPGQQRGDAGLLRRPDAVGPHADADHLETLIGPEQRRRRVRQVPDRHGVAGGAQRTDRGLEAGELTARVRVIRRVLDVGKVAAHALDREARARGGPSGQGHGLFGADPLPVVAGLDLQVKPHGPTVGRQAVDGLAVVGDQPAVEGGGLGQVVQGHVTEDVERAGQPGRSQGARLVQRVHAEPVGAAGEERPRRRDEPVPVGVGLDGGREDRLAHQLPEGPDVVREGRRVDFTPGSHGRALWAQRAPHEQPARAGEQTQQRRRDHVGAPAQVLGGQEEPHGVEREGRVGRETAHQPGRQKEPGLVREVGEPEAEHRDHPDQKRPDDVDEERRPRETGAHPAGEHHRQQVAGNGTHRASEADQEHVAHQSGAWSTGRVERTRYQ